MSEFLIIRLSSQPERTIPWLVWAPQHNEVIASGQLSSLADLSQLSDYAQQRQVLALAPTDEMLLTRIALPVGSSRQLQTVLPYLLEDELAQDVDELHVHLLDKQSHSADVAVIEHSKMVQWLQALTDADMAVSRLIPDVLCLPQFTEGMTAAQLDEQWLIRRDRYLGAGVDSGWLSLWLKAQDSLPIESDTEGDEVEASELDDPARPAVVVHHYTPAPEDDTAGDWRAEAPELVMQLLAKGALESKVNLLSGTYKRQPSWHRYIKPWRKVAIAAGILLTVFVVEHWLSIQRIEQQQLAYKAETERVFRTVFPDKKRIPSLSYLKRQVNDELARLGGGARDSGLLFWMAELKPSLEKVPSLSIRSLKYDHKRAELRLQASAAEFQHFELLRSVLLEKFEVNQGPLNRQDSKVEGTFVLRSKS